MVGPSILKITIIITNLLLNLSGHYQHKMGRKKGTEGNSPGNLEHKLNMTLRNT